MIRVTYHAPNEDPTTQGVTPREFRLLTGSHERATTAQIEDGQLLLTDDANNQIAGYAPGWVRWEKGE